MTVTGSREALRNALEQSQVVLSRAFDRVHGLPRTTDSNLAIAIGKQRAANAAALALSPDPAGVTLTVEEIARIIDPDNWHLYDCANKMTLLKRAVSGWRVESSAAKATAILSLIQSKMVQPSIDTLPATSGTVAPELSGSPRWPRAGDRMTFLGKNGHNYELQAALKIFEVGAEYTVRGCDVGDWRHTISFEGKPGHFNGVMFAQLSTDASSASDPSLQAEPLLTHPPFNKGNE